ncbi:MAG: hypothetical protein JWO24_1946, partial [Rhodospirillales bacterium]|nr:hypothetical protein [Rhodospirillales bacterium]
MGNYHDEFPTITAIEPDGRLILDWGRPELNEFLEGADYFAADH